MDICKLPKALIPRTVSLKTLKSLEKSHIIPYNQMNRPLHPIRCVAALGASIWCQLKVFLSSK